MRTRVSVTGMLLSLLGLVGLLVIAVDPQTALAQTRPDRGIPDITGPNSRGDESEEFQQSGRFVNLTRGLNSLGEIDDDLPDPEPPFCLDNPGAASCDAQRRRHFSIRVPRQLSQFTVWIFDGDSRKQTGGSFSWDNCQGTGCADLMNEMQYTLFLDPSGPFQASEVPTGQAQRANTCPDDLVRTFFGASMPDNKWVGFTVEQTPGSCGLRLLSDGITQVPNDTCGYHLVLNWIPNVPPEPVLLTHEQANFKVGVSGLGVNLFVYDESNIGYNGVGSNFPGPTTFDGTFVFTIPVNFVTEPVWFTPLFEGDFDVANDGDDPNFLGLPIFPSRNALPEGTKPGNPADGGVATDPLLSWGAPEAPNVIYTLTAPGDVWTRKNLNPSGDGEWESFSLGKETGGPPLPIVDDTVSSIPNGDYRLEVKGLDARNTVFISFKHPATSDPVGGECKGEVAQLTLRNNGAEGDIVVKNEVGDSLGEFPQVPGGGTFLVNIPEPTPSISVNKTKIPTSCDTDGFSEDNAGDESGPCEVFGAGSIFGDFEVANGVSSIGGPLPKSARCSDSTDDKNLDGSGHSGRYCLPANETRLRSLTLEYTADDCDFTNNRQSGKVKCRDRGALPELAQIQVIGGGEVYFDGSYVSVGSQILLAPRKPGRPIAGNTRVRIKNEQGTLVQRVRLHTSCSKPLERGNQFGSLLVKDLKTVAK